MLAQVIQCCRCEFHTFPGAAAYTQSAAAYTQSAAAYTKGTAAYMVSAAAYMGKVRIKLPQSSWAGAGTELGERFTWEPLGCYTVFVCLQYLLPYLICIAP